MTSAPDRKLQGVLSLYTQSEGARGDAKIKAVLDSLDEGFFVFDSDGLGTDLYSKKAEQIFATSIEGTKLVDILRLESPEREEIELWINALFDEAIAFSDIASLGPKTYTHLEGRSIYLEFRPLRESHGKIFNILVIASDRTQQESEQKAIAEKHREIDLIIHLSKNRVDFAKFLRFFKSFVELNRDLDFIAAPTHAVVSFRRNIHTIKGAAGSFFIDELKNALHQFESEMAFAKSHQSLRKMLKTRFKSLSETWVFFITSFIEKYQFVFGAHFSYFSRTIEIGEDRLKHFYERIRGQELLAQTYVQDVFSVPAEELFQGLKSKAASIARQLGKEILPVKVNCNNHRILAEPYEELFATFIHLIQNSLDHGIEKPEARLSQGKPPQGSLRFELRSEGHGSGEGWMMVFQDDGAGIDFAKIRQKAVALRGPEAETLPESALIEMIFEDDFSTADQITSFSGRGVGMGAVRSAVLNLRGTIEVFTEPAKGTQIIIHVPQIWRL